MLKDECNIPQIVDDLCLAKDHFRGKTKYFMASEKKSQFLKLNEFQYKIFSELLPYLKQERNKKVLDKKCYEISEGKISIKNVLNVLYKYNLFEESNIKPLSKVTIDFNSKKAIELSLDNFQKRHKKLLNIMYYILLGILFPILLLSLYEILFMHESVHKILISSNFNWKQVNILSILFIFIEFIVSALLHELGHLLTANRKEIIWKSLNISFVWGISPIFFIRYQNFCVYRSIDKIKVLSAGVVMNILQICIYLQLCLVINSWIFAMGIFLNLSCILNCIIPLGTSDGYHIMSIFFGIEGARWKALVLMSQMLSNPIKMLKQNSKDDIAFMIYVGFSYVLGIYGSIQLLNTLLKTINIFSINNYVISIIVIAFFIVITIGYIIKFLKSLKRLPSKISN